MLSTVVATSYRWFIAAYVHVTGYSCTLLSSAALVGCVLLFGWQRVAEKTSLDSENMLNQLALSLCERLTAVEQHLLTVGSRSVKESAPRGVAAAVVYCVW